MKFFLAMMCLTLFKPLNAQSLGGYPIADYLVSAIHTDTCLIPNFVTGLPNDSLWVNFVNGDTMLGNFGQEWVDQVGTDLLLETGYHGDNYEVSLLLSTGLYSSIFNVTNISWTSITNTDWTYRTPPCFTGTGTNISRFVRPLDFVTDFGLTVSDTVAGIKITFLTTSGAPDFAGAYIIGIPCSATSSQFSVEACNSYTSPSGTYIWTETGSFIDTLTNVMGCDSILYIGLTIFDSINTSVSLSGGTTMIAGETGVIYQWVKCPTMIAIPGAVNQSYTALENGSYAVIISENGCSDTSECIDINQLGLLENTFDDKLSLYPNPSNGSFTLNWGASKDLIIIDVMNTNGIHIQSGKYSGTKVIFQLDQPPGIYFINIKDGDKNTTVRMALF